MSRERIGASNIPIWRATAGRVINTISVSKPSFDIEQFLLGTGVRIIKVTGKMQGADEV